jgi:flagella basal body P-ring formation protein FlgA
MSKIVISRYTALHCLVAVTIGMCSLSLQASEAVDALTHQAKTWVSELKGQEPETIQFESLDTRIQVERCPRWLFDLPFGEGQGLRARCMTPKQQIFLRTTQPVRGPERASPPTSGSPIRPKAEASEPVLVLVARENLSSQQRLLPESVELREVPHDQVRGGAHLYLGSAAGLDAMQTTRAVKAGEPLRLQDVRPAILVRRGDIVQLRHAQVPGLTLNIRVEALEDGRLGQRIRFKNQQSGRFTMGEVVDQGLAMIR